MRQVSLFDASGGLKRTARAEVEVYMMYPEDDVSRELALMVLEHEWRRFCLAPDEPYRFSNLTETIINAAHKRATQRVIAGYVTIVMCELQNLGRNPSLEAASHIISEMVLDREIEPNIAFLKKGEIEFSDKVLVSDIAQIKKLFRAHRSVADFCATMVSCSEMLELNHPFQENPDADLIEYLRPYTSKVLFLVLNKIQSGIFGEYQIVQFLIVPCLLQLCFQTGRLPRFELELANSDRRLGTGTPKS